MYAVILAGGGGTRLWPLSTPERPKPFLPLLGERSLLQLTGDRLAGLLAPADVYVVADRRYGPVVEAQLPGATVVAEPQGRNTAAAVALATLAIERAADEVMLILPADHTIRRTDLFLGVLRGAAKGVAPGAFGIAAPLVTLGIQPAGPATEYGYLRPQVAAGELIDGLLAYPLEAFEEKPTGERARQLCAMPGVAWNAGMFIWRREAIRRALAAYAPDVLELVQAGLVGDLEAAYQRVRATSIDYAVMEPAAAAGQVVMLGIEVGWSDLGSWTALLERLGARGVTGAVIPAGGAVDVGPADLLVRRDSWPDRGPFALEAGPGTMGPFTTPTAHLAGAGPARPIVQGLLDRVIASEN
ncbi:MAG: sugar phosphate nucleotidyltransferase [Candidatus Limnocylindrales bacterium]